ncbi:MAG: recombination mediator RecR [Candidatus Krumholzibacteria bacterium]|nr:recombination mediator RecR [Candidatus Krumholzibacteria bacterium]MDH4337307.1 recombination mediator RecR [Candidatus Krumholzibacteria bacterium]MDH5269980.1 recombination mediator RecR [Candidatus Krumholzibacteria bacterium]
MDLGSETLNALVKSLARLPGIGTKSALRMALYLLRPESTDAERISELLSELKTRVRFCATCGAITESDQCAICKDPARSQDLICVVEQPQDMIVMERTRHYRGLYHVLHGVLSPVDGVGPDDLSLRALEARVRDGQVRELIVATNPTVEGDATALYIARIVSPFGCTVTRLARGLPMGGTLEFVDDTTLARAIDRRETL